MTSQMRLQKMDKYSFNDIVGHVNSSLFKGNNNDSYLINAPEILKIDGKSGTKFRHFLNNLCSIPNIKYLEVGAYTGSSIISALYNNQTVEGVTFDNWSEYGGPKDTFYKNLSLLKNPKLKIYESDCFLFDRNNLSGVDIYFYDGSHDMYSQYRGISFFSQCLNKPAIIIVDDWNNQHDKNTQKGTKDAISDFGLNVLWYWETVNFVPPNSGDGSDGWWGGQYIALVH